MNALRYKQIQELFQEAADLPPDEQQEFLKTACGDDKELLADLKAMLEEDARDGSLLDSDVAHLAHQVLDGELKAPQHFRQFGPYRLGRILGEGGMGVVYLAEREDLHNQVAIKILRDAALSPARRERFALEQRTLAQLDHPSIARLYDAGTLEDGTPYFVMEYIEGLPLTKYCREKACSIKTRLKLFRAVCEAVQYAHAHALIHRDLKPSNILVKSDGTVKLLDFGIAKQLDSITDQTLTGLRLMTPAYAAPEQLRGKQTGIRTDVYSLGVILYELLTDQLPFDLSTSTPGEAEWIVLNKDPERPSAVVKRKLKSPGNDISKGSWNDLDALCLVAMHKDADRRYQSVEALIRDIDHYLHGEPLEARTDRITYKAGKFLRRHRGPVLASVAVLIAVISLVAFFVYRLARARNEALAQAERSQRIEQFMIHLFDGDKGNHQSGPSSDLRAVDVLDRGAKEAGRLSKVPQVQAELYQTLGDLYERLGKFDRADSALRSALEVRKAYFGQESAPVAETLVSLGVVRADDSKFPEAQQLARKGLAIDSKLLPPTDLALARDRIGLGKVLEMSGNYKEATEVLSKAVDSLSRPGAPPADLAMALDALATTNFENGQIAAAKSQFQKALALDRSIYGDSYPLVGEELVNLGSIEFQLQRFPQAEKYYRSGLESTRSWYGPDNVTVATVSQLLGQALIKEGQLGEAETFLKQALSIHEKLYGKVHANVAMDLNALAVAVENAGRWTEAEAYFNRMLAIDQALYGGKHPQAAIALNNLAELNRKMKRYPQAEKLSREAIDTASQVLPPDHLYAGVVQLGLGKTLLEEKRYREAEPYLMKSYLILEKQGNPSMQTLQDTRKALAADYAALGRPAEARKFKEESVTVSTPKK